MNIYQLTELDKLNAAFYQASKESYWKPATQLYHSNLLLNNVKLQEELRSGTYKMQKTINFYISERGHTRYIESPTIRDRIVQKVLTKEILIPSIRPALIYDNYASLENRGTSFARKRVLIMLRKFVEMYGLDGYVMLVDVHRYFPSIDHEILKQMVYKRIHQHSWDIIKLTNYIIDNSSDSDVGLNLGSEAPQIFAVYYLTPVDNYIKTVKGVKFYGRYMDDLIIFAPTKQELHQLLDEIQYQLSLLKLTINDRKTQILKISHGFTYLQVKYDINM